MIAGYVFTLFLHVISSHYFFALFFLWHLDGVGRALAVKHQKHGFILGAVPVNLARLVDAGRALGHGIGFAGIVVRAVADPPGPLRNIDEAVGVVGVRRAHSV